MTARRGAKKIDPITLEILWTRLISAVDESATALVRTAFSASIRDANDFGCALFNTDYELVAQCTLGTPGLIAAATFAMRAVGEAYPAESLKDGDVLITNDPWVCAGHLNDIAIVTPIFHKRRLVAYAICIAHEIDIGGRMMTTETREVYEEGLFIPIMKFYEAGKANETVFKFLHANIRMPDNVIGDLRAQLAANDTLARRLVQLLTEYGMADIRALARIIISRTEAAVRASIRQFPEGTCSNEVLIDQFDGVPVRIVCNVTLKDGGVTVDYSGSSAQIARGVNVCLDYTTANTITALKCALSPLMPNNQGGLSPFTIIAPEGSILNCRFPAAVNSRTSVSQFLPEIVLAALSKLIPDHVIAGSGSSPTWPFRATGHRKNGRQFFVFSISKGGLGARPRSDGVSVVAFPGNSSVPPAEIVETSGPVVYEKKELRTDSGGAGKFRGGLGMHAVIRVLGGDLGPAGQVIMSAMGGRLHYPVPGLLGGHDAPKGVVSVNGERSTISGRQVSLGPDGFLEIMTPGGGGYGDPLERDLAMVEDDVRNGLVTPEEACSAYGVVMRGASVDARASAELRARMKRDLSAAK